MKLSVIIVNFNTRDLTLDCIKSVGEVSRDIVYEIIVIDNGSTDDSLMAFKNLKLNSQNYGSKISIIENSRNLGFAKAVNQGIKRSNGKYILLLNSDAIIKKGSVNKLLDFAESARDAGAVGPRLINPDGSVQGSVFRLPTLLRTIKQYWFGKKELLEKYSPSGNKPILVEALSMACLLITPACISKAGLLNEKYFFYYEDLDYCRKINKSGLKVYFLPSSEVIHYHGSSGKYLAGPDLQWKRLIPSSKIYHGLVTYYLIYFVIKTAQICSTLSKKS